MTDSLVGSMLDQLRVWAGLGPAPDGRADAEGPDDQDAAAAALRPRVDAAGHIVVATVADQQAAAVSGAKRSRAGRLSRAISQARSFALGCLMPTVCRRKVIRACSLLGVRDSDRGALVGGAPVPT